MMFVRALLLEFIAGALRSTGFSSREFTLTVRCSLCQKIHKQPWRGAMLVLLGNRLSEEAWS